MIPSAITQAVDRRLKARNEFSRLAIEEELAKEYTIGDDEPTVEDDEFHCMISELHSNYVSRGLARDDH